MEKEVPHFGMMHLLRTVLSRSTDRLAEESDNLATLSQFIVLATLASQAQALNQTEIVELTGIDRSTTADIIRRLKAKGLIRRTRSTVDQRCQQVRLTDKGTEVLGKMAPIVSRIESEFLNALPLRDHNSFLNALRVLARLDFDQRQAKAA